MHSCSDRTNLWRLSPISSTPAYSPFLGFIQFNITLFYMVLRAGDFKLSQFRMSMRRDNTRARRDGHQHRCLDDYSVKLSRPHPLQTHALPDRAVGAAISPSHVDDLAPPAGQKQ